MNINVNYDDKKLKEIQIDFQLDQKVSETSKTYTGAHESQFSPLASKIFGFPWVDKVLIEPEKVSVWRQDWVEWDILAQPLADMIEQHFSHYDDDQKVEENQEPPQVQHDNQANDGSEDEEVILGEEAQVIWDFIQQQINPQLASHGGKVKMLDFQNGVVYLQMMGGCQGCGMAAQTMREGIQTALAAEFPEVKSVKDVTDHSQGLNPYY